MSIKNPFRLTIITVSVLFFGALIVLKILNIISSEEYSQFEEIYEKTVPANRGNIYAANNELLAVTAPSYNLFFDLEYALKTGVKDKQFKKLANDFAQIFQDKSPLEYLRHLNLGIRSNKKYYPIHDRLSFEEMKLLKALKYYKKPLHGGLIIEIVTSRENPNANLAVRTIGSLNEHGWGASGLEYSYNADLMGQDGKCFFINKSGAGKLKIKDRQNLDAKDGRDLITTIDLGLQDIVEDALLRQLELYEADFGTAILMEVKTGKIKAISNLQKTQDTKYAEIFNHGVSSQIEPGSTIKLASIMAYFEDYNADIDDTIDCKNGIYQFPGAPILTRDSKKLGVVSLKEAFAHSSNIGIARLIKKYYNHNPQKFIDRLSSFGLGEKSKIDLKGKLLPTPKIPAPSNNNWSGISLPWMSFGYGLNLTSLDILTFYNAVANNGYLVHPYLGFAFRDGSQLTPIERDNISYTICSQSTIQKIKILLSEVIKNGTGKDLLDLPFSVSGKTGTTVKNYSNSSTDNNKQYQSSFVGFFPSEKPQYSCIVLVDNPNKDIGYYGSVVAIPVFKEIAHKIYIQQGLHWLNSSKNNMVFSDSKLNQPSISKDRLIDKKLLNQNNYPNVVGMHIREALHLLELGGYQVLIKGDLGNVKKQYPKAHSPIKPDLSITLFI